MCCCCVCVVVVMCVVVVVCVWLCVCVWAFGQSVCFSSPSPSLDYIHAMPWHVTIPSITLLSNAIDRRLIRKIYVIVFVVSSK